MKNDTHPQLHPVVFIDLSTGTEFITTSTRKSDETKKINGVDHYVMKVEISSASHPFYTGKRKLVDTAGRVDKFRARIKKAQTINEKKVEKVDEDKSLSEIIEEKKEKKNKATAAKKASAEKKPKAARKTAKKA